MRMRRVCGVLLGGLLALVTGLTGARAQAPAEPAPTATEPTPTAPMESPPSDPVAQDSPPSDPGQPMTERMPPEVAATPGEWTPRSRVGWSVMLGGGVGDFSSSDVRSQTGLGGSWNLRLTSGTRLPFAWEVAYLGAANDVSGALIDNDAYMLRNTIEANLRFNAPIVLPTVMIAPFATAGTGWSRYNIMNSGDFIRGTAREDDQFIIPLGAGLAMGYQGFTAEARFTYRFAFNDEMFGDNDMGTWNVSAGLGTEF